MKTNRETYNPSAPFQTIKDAARTTGLSQFFLRNGVKDGTIPHIKSGSTYFINVPLFFEAMNAQSVIGA